MTFQTRLAQLASAALEFLSPSRCGACQAPGAEPLFCKPCSAELQRLVSGHHQESRLDELPLVTLGPFEPPLSDAIKQLKFHGRSELARPLAQLWWSTCRAALAPERTWRLVPVPLHPARLVERGYNQSLLTARKLSAMSRLSCDPDLLRRVRATRQQATLDARLRAANVHEAFQPARGAHAQEGTHIVLVDDVVTTGATIRACASAAREAGLRVSAVWALARSTRG